MKTHKFAVGDSVDYITDFLGQVRFNILQQTRDEAGNPEYELGWFFNKSEGMLWTYDPEHPEKFKELLVLYGCLEDDLNPVYSQDELGNLFTVGYFEGWLDFDTMIKIAEDDGLSERISLCQFRDLAERCCPECSDREECCKSLIIGNGLSPKCKDIKEE